jgi:pyrrolidone-carboxylate peptidase
VGTGTNSLTTSSYSSPTWASRLKAYLALAWKKLKALASALYALVLDNLFALIALPAFFMGVMWLVTTYIDAPRRAAWMRALAGGRAAPSFSWLGCNSTDPTEANPCVLGGGAASVCAAVDPAASAPVLRLDISAPLRDIAARLSPAWGSCLAVSDDPGRYLCNYLYASSLRRLQHAQQPQGGSAPAAPRHHALFVHIPLAETIALPRQAQFLCALASAIAASLEEGRVGAPGSALAAVTPPAAASANRCAGRLARGQDVPDHAPVRRAL